MSSAAESELARSAANGNQAAFAEIVRLHQQAVYNVAYRMLGNAHDAEDATQDAFIRAYQFFDRFDLDRPLAPWLKRIAVNVCLNRLNAEKPASSLDDNLPPPKDPHPGPEAQTATRQRQEQIRADLIEHVINPVLPKDMVDEKLKIYTNPTGRFVVGGPLGDAGLTGRKIIVDTYGGMASHGGGAFSGKDPTKVDRSAAYMARYIAKNVVASGLADKCTLQMAYAIGVAKPVSLMVFCDGTHRVSEDRIRQLILKHFDLTPRGIIKHLDLLKPIYRKTATYGHFGRTERSFTWERTDMAKTLAKDA